MARVGRVVDIPTPSIWEWSGRDRPECLGPDTPKADQSQFPVLAWWATLVRESSDGFRLIGPCATLHRVEQRRNIAMPVGGVWKN